jgi:hypothetical protein
VATPGPGGSKRIDELEIGDFVMGPAGQTKVIGFLFRDPATIDPNYLRLSTNDGGSVTLSPEHMLPINGVNKMAAAANVGDGLLTNASATETTTTVITAIDVVTEPGAYHIYVEADYYYVKDVTNAAGPWLASSNNLTYDGRPGLTFWTNGLMYPRSKECYAEKRPINMTPELILSLSNDRRERSGQLSDCQSYSVVEGLP